MTKDIAAQTPGSQTSGLAVKAIGSQFELVIAASNRLREMRHGGVGPKVERQGSDMSTVLLEIELGLTGREYLTKFVELQPPPRRTRR